MYAEYAKDPRMKRNVGISRRLLPLLDNDRRLAELFHGMLFSLPGSPVMYYGDEIGMGDNIYLGDRDGVRTPMQWTPDRNGGFSTADFAQLYLPSLMDPVYGYASVNVESQLRNPSSFLHWVQRMIIARKQHPVFGTGSFEVLDVANPAVFAYLRYQVREAGPEREIIEDLVLCVNNLSKVAQPVELELGPWAGKQPVELFGRVPFPPIGELPYFITLPPYGFYWFSLVDRLGDDLK
jgi:maltose alpha-D-glucosyltransferase/alpha-amylase